MSAEKVRCTNHLCRFGRNEGQFVVIADRANCRFKENCAAWRAHQGYEDPPPPLPSAPTRRRTIAIACGAAALAAAAGGTLIATTGGQAQSSEKQQPVVTEDPALLRDRAEGTAVDIQRAASRILRTHRALIIAEDASQIRDEEITNMSAVGRTAQEVLDRARPATGDSQLFARISRERREEIHKDNDSYIDGLVRLAGFPPALTTKLLQDLRLRISGVKDDEAALDLISDHLDVTRTAGKLDEQRVFADFRKSLPPTP